MKFLIVIFLLVTALTGCSKNSDSSTASSFEAKTASPNNEANSPARFLAYEHSLDLSTSADKVATIYQAALSTCQPTEADQCVVLSSNLSTGAMVSAEIKFRAKPSSIKKIMAALATQGKVTNQKMTADDLAHPIEDAAKKLEMLQDYRTRLEALRGRANIDLDSLIKLTKELAMVQSEIESIAGEKSHLMQRVETEILNVSIISSDKQSSWEPLSNALSNFASHLVDAFSGAITGIAYIIPWFITLIIFAWITRLFWRRWKRPN